MKKFLLPNAGANLKNTQVAIALSIAECQKLGVQDFSVVVGTKENFESTEIGKLLGNIRFDKFAAQFIRERVWHPSQQIQELTGGEVELRITLSSLHEIEPWVLSWGQHAKVMGPKELIAHIRTNLEVSLAALRERRPKRS
jgi:predicted DNA-binding transcriptional regulator YafY